MGQKKIVKRITICLTPAIAKRYLDNKYYRQRKLDVATAEQYARDIKAGRWKDELCTLDTPIMITPKGKIMNGQHRCAAVVISNKPIFIDIAKDVPEEMFDFIDGGKARTVSQFIKCEYSSQVSALAKFANAISLGRPILSSLKGNVAHVGKSNIHASRSEILSFVESNSDDLIECNRIAQNCYRAFNGGSKYEYSAAAWVIGLIHGQDGLTKIRNVAHELCQPAPSSAMLVRVKDATKNKIMDAKQKKFQIRHGYWIGLMLAIYEAYNTPRVRITEKDIDNAMEMYDKALKEGMHEEH